MVCDVADADHAHVLPPSTKTFVPAPEPEIQLPLATSASGATVNTTREHGQLSATSVSLSGSPQDHVHFNGSNTVITPAGTAGPPVRPAPASGAHPTHLPPLPW